MEEDPMAQLHAEITEFEEALDHPQMQDARAAVPDGVDPDDLEKLKLYRDALAKRVGGGS